MFDIIKTSLTELGRPAVAATLLTTPLIVEHLTIPTALYAQTPEPGRAALNPPSNPRTIDGLPTDDAKALVVGSAVLGFVVCGAGAAVYMMRRRKGEEVDLSDVEDLAVGVMEVAGPDIIAGGLEAAGEILGSIIESIGDSN